jgi:hypothetical protein
LDTIRSQSPGHARSRTPTTSISLAPSAAGRNEVDGMSAADDEEPGHNNTATQRPTRR